MILLFDCNSICYSAFYSIGGLSNKDQKTGVLFGFCNEILKYGKMFKTDQMIFCWDSRQNKRKSFYPSYKELRGKKKQELSVNEKKKLNEAYRQFDLLREEVLYDLGFKNVFMKTGYESDDLIATIVKQYPNKEFVILSTDDDLLQLLDDNVMVYNIRRKTKETIRSFCDQYHIAPALWSEVKAIGGCKSDEVKGLLGIGEQTALQYIRGELLKDGKKYKYIKDHIDEIAFFRSLVKLPFDDKLSFEIKTDNITKKKINAVCNKYGFRSFLNDGLIRWRKVFKI